MGTGTQQWADVLDVLLIGLMAHRLFLLFRGTAVLQVLAGLALLATLQWFAASAGLVLTHRLLQAAMPVAALVLVVAFRNEIRDALLQVNPARLVAGRPSRSLDLELGALAEAVSRLRDTRTGALIVLQNRQRLAPHLHEGVVLRGRFSPQVLAALFAKESPVHDGAIILRGDRIERVGTFLPLSMKADLPAEFGTRHRAAVGLSERTDAVILVVSEERGEVSVVHRGSVYPVGEMSDLEPLLRRLWLGHPSPGAPGMNRGEALRQAAAFVAILASVALGRWLLAGRPAQITLTTAIAARGVPEDLELQGLYRGDAPGLFRAPLERVEVKVGGRQPLIDALSAEEVHASIDLSGMAAGRHEVPLGAANLELPPGLTAMQVSPSRVVVELERRIARRLPIAAQLVGDVPRGFDVTAVVVPSEVTVTGPVSQMEGRDRVRTEAIDLTGLGPRGSPRTFTVGFELTPASLRPSRGQPGRVRVTVTLTPKPTR